jgi:8-oxo-dGTP diphosphatase
MITNFIDKIALIEIKDKKILVTLNKDKDVWYLPGGKRKQGESDAQALKREIKEELNIDIIPHSIKKYGVFQAQAHGKTEGLMVRMTCYTADHKGNLSPSAEIGKLDYFDYSQKEKTSKVDHLIFDDLKKKGIIV